MESQIKIEFIVESPKNRLNQGDILKDLSVIVTTDYDFEKSKALFVEVNLKYAIVINQECDLEHDFNAHNEQSANQDKYLPNVLILPAYLEPEFKSGKHRGESIVAETYNSERFKIIKQNNNARFHFINKFEDLQIPDLIIDFKHLYTINRDFIYNNINRNYLASICEIYREGISHRYSHYLSRIGLPDRET